LIFSINGESSMNQGPWFWKYVSLYSSRNLRRARCQTVVGYNEDNQPYHHTRMYILCISIQCKYTINNHFVRHSWLISPFMIHLMSHAQYTWSSLYLLFILKSHGHNEIWLPIKIYNKISQTKRWNYWCVTFLWISFTFETSSSLWAQNRKIERLSFLPPPFAVPAAQAC